MGLMGTWTGRRGDRRLLPQVSPRTATGLSLVEVERDRTASRWTGAGRRLSGLLQRLAFTRQIRRTADGLLKGLSTAARITPHPGGGFRATCWNPGSQSTCLTLRR